MKIRDYIILVLSALVPVVYSMIKAKNPDIPISEANFIELIMWIFERALYATGATIIAVKSHKAIILRKYTLQVKK